jgi:hypothetical protein
VVLQQIGVALVRQLCRDVLEQRGAAGQAVGHALDALPEVQHLLVEQRGDAAFGQREGAGVGLVRVDAGVHVQAPLVDRGMHAGLDGRRVGALHELLALQVHHAHVIGAHGQVVRAAGRDRHQLPALHPQRHVAACADQQPPLGQEVARREHLLLDATQRSRCIHGAPSALKH